MAAGDIPIESRAAEEVLMSSGLGTSGSIESVQVAAPGSAASNPAFDVTPAALVTRIVTERGAFAPADLGRALV